jgi:hypothetical protein
LDTTQTTIDNQIGSTRFTQALSSWKREHPAFYAKITAKRIYDLRNALASLRIEYRACSDDICRTNVKAKADIINLELKELGG